jgi:hypothetical protein
MSPISVETINGGIRVDTGSWKIEHTAQMGGAWTSLIPARGAAGNLLRSPLTSAIRCLASDGSLREYRESFDTQARLRSEVIGPVSAVVAEGVFRDERGQTVPVGFRRRTEYHDNWLIWSTLEIMSDCGCADVVELCAAKVVLRPGLTHCAVKLHPTQAGGSDLLGTSGEFSLVPNATAFLSRFTPLQVLCADRAGDGIEFFPGSDLAAWDFACKGDVGLGFYRVAQGADGTRVELMPYCMTQRRVRTTLQGKLALKFGVGLPVAPVSLRHRAPQFISPLPDASWNAIETMKAYADSGLETLCFRNDVDSSGRYWRNGVYPPYDAAGMDELKDAINAAHAAGLKIIARVGVHEVHTSVPEYTRHGGEWMHMAAPSLGPIRSWRGNDETGVLMCLNSGWLEFIKRYIDTVLTALPWDGVYLEGATPYPCCHPAHGRAFHSDIDGLLNLLAWCRTRVGAGIVRSGPTPGRSFMVDNLIGRT